MADQQVGGAGYVAASQHPPEICSIGDLLLVRRPLRRYFGHAIVGKSRHYPNMDTWCVGDLPTHRFLRAGGLERDMPLPLQPRSNAVVYGTDRETAQLARYQTQNRRWVGEPARLLAQCPILRAFWVYIAAPIRLV